MAPRQDLSDLVSFLKLTGFWPYLGDQRSRRWFQIVRLCFFAKMVALWIISAYLIGIAVFLKKNYAGIVLCTPYMVVQSVLIFCNGHHLQSFVHIMNATLIRRKERWQKDILNDLLSPLWKIIRISGFYCLLLLTVAFFGPILYDTVTTIFMDAEPINLNVTVDGLLPSDKKGSFLYYFLQWYNAFLEGTSFTYFLGLVSILPLMVSYIRVEIKILCRKIQECGKIENDEEETLFREIIEDHINIMRLTEVTNKFLAAPILLQNVAAAAAITMFLYAMVNSISQGYHNISSLLFSLNAPIAMITVVFVSCYSGEMLHSESLYIYDCFLKIDWYNKTVKRQKDVLIVLMHVQRPLRIHFRGNPVDLRAFKQVINATYSCFMLLKSFA